MKYPLLITLMALSLLPMKTWAAKPSNPPKASRSAPEVYAATEEGSAAPRETPNTTAFDVVPSDQTDALIKRLKLVETLIKRYGRAYDYRVLTTKDLEGLLAKLEAVPVENSGP